MLFINELLQKERKKRETFVYILKLVFSSGVAKTKRDYFPTLYEGFAIITEPSKARNPP